MYQRAVVNREMLIDLQLNSHLPCGGALVNYSDTVSRAGQCVQQGSLHPDKEVQLIRTELERVRGGY